MTPGTPNPHRHHSSSHQRPCHHCVRHHRHRQRRHNSTASSEGRQGCSSTLPIRAMIPCSLDHAPTPPNPILPQAWGYTNNTLPARAAIVRNTLTPVPAMPAEDVATTPTWPSGLSRDRVQAHRLWPRDPGPQHLQALTNGGTCAHHAPAGPGYRPHGARDPHLRLGPLAPRRVSAHSRTCLERLPTKLMRNHQLA